MPDLAGPRGRSVSLRPQRVPPLPLAQLLGPGKPGVRPLPRLARGWGRTALPAHISKPLQYPKVSLKTLRELTWSDSKAQDIGENAGHAEIRHPANLSLQPQRPMENQ